MTDFSMFFGRCDQIFELFKNRPRLFKSHAKFGANRSRDDCEKLAGKKEKNKSTEKHIITEILKN